MNTEKPTAHIDNYYPYEDKRTHIYVVNVIFGEKKWKVRKRYGEFVELSGALDKESYTFLPDLPPKTLFGKLQDQRVLEKRKTAANNFLSYVLSRPDTLSSRQVLDFLEITDKLSQPVTPLQPELIKEINSSRFSLSSLVYEPSEGLLFSGYEDTTVTSRLGRVWTIIEPDEIGSLAISSHLDSTPSNFTTIFSLTTDFKVRCLHYDKISKRLFAGLGDGRLAIYLVMTDSMTLELIQYITVHSAPTVQISASSMLILSAGYDGTIRIIDKKDLKVISGGRLTNRLSGGKISSCLLDESRRKAIIGTSKGEILIYDLLKDSLRFCFTHKISPSGFVSAIAIASGTIFIGNCDKVSCYHYLTLISEKIITKTAEFTIKSDTQKVRKVHCIVHDPINKRLLVGLGSSVVIWNLTDGSCICSFRTHWQGVYQIIMVDKTNYIITGGEDGFIKVWNIGKIRCTQSLTLKEDPHIVSDEFSGSNSMNESDRGKSIKIYRYNAKESHETEISKEVSEFGYLGNIDKVNLSPHENYLPQVNYNTETTSLNSCSSDLFEPSFSIRNECAVNDADESNSSTTKLSGTKNKPGGIVINTRTHENCDTSVKKGDFVRPFVNNNESDGDSDENDDLLGAFETIRI